MRSRKIIQTVFLSAFLTVSASLALTGAAWAGPPSDLVKAKQTELFTLLAGDDDTSKKKVAAIFDELLDYDAIAEGSLGSEWANRSDAEKKELTGLLKQLVTRAYEKNLRKTLAYAIEYVGEEKTGEDVLVKTKAKHKTDAREEPIAIDFLLRANTNSSQKTAFRVRDIVTEDVSLVSSYRSQFTKIIKKDGFPALITKLKDKLAKGDV